MLAKLCRVADPGIVFGENGERDSLPVNTLIARTESRIDPSEPFSQALLPFAVLPYSPQLWFNNAILLNVNWSGYQNGN